MKDKTKIIRSIFLDKGARKKLFYGEQKIFSVDSGLAIKRERSAIKSAMMAYFERDSVLEIFLNICRVNETKNFTSINTATKNSYLRQYAHYLLVRKLMDDATFYKTIPDTWSTLFSRSENQIRERNQLPICTKI